MSVSIDWSEIIGISSERILDRQKIPKIPKARLKVTTFGAGCNIIQRGAANRNLTFLCAP